MLATSDLHALNKYVPSGYFRSDLRDGKKRKDEAPEKNPSNPIIAYATDGIHTTGPLMHARQWHVARMVHRST